MAGTVATYNSFLRVAAPVTFQQTQRLGRPQSLHTRQGGCPSDGELRRALRGHWPPGVSAPLLISGTRGPLHCSGHLGVVQPRQPGRSCPAAPVLTPGCQLQTAVRTWGHMVHPETCLMLGMWDGLLQR